MKNEINNLNQENDPDTLNIYSFYDNKSKLFDTPFFCKSDLFAGRHYRMVSEKEGSLMEKFREDFDVFRLGSINTNTGEVVSNVEIIITGKLQKGDEK